jgi:hypothetical protein
VATVLSTRRGGGVELFVLGVWAACVRRVGPFVWGEAQPLDYKYIQLSLNLIDSHLALLTGLKKSSLKSTRSSLHKEFDLS